jgi:zinc protease
MLRSPRAAVVAALVLLSWAGRVQAAELPPAERLVLPNGLTVVLAPDPRARLVSVAVGYHAGKGDEPDGLRGLAHAVEHQVALHTKHVPDVTRALEAAGATHYGAETRADRTSYYETVPPERLASALWIESDRMGHAAEAVTEERITAQAATIANELRDRGADSAMSALPPLLQDELYPGGHPYATHGEADKTTGLHAADVLAFLRTWYTPANATLAIAGAFDRDAALALVTRDFGGLPSCPPPERPPAPERPEEAVFLLMRAGVLHDKLLLAWRTPSFGSDDDAALDVVATILGSAGDRGLPKLLVATHRVLGVAARQISFARGSTFMVEITLPPGAPLDDILATTQAAIDELGHRDIAAAVAQAQALERARRTERLEFPWARAAELAAWPPMPDGETPSTFDWDVARHEAVRATDVARVVTTFLSPWRRVLGTVLVDLRFPYSGVAIRRDTEHR